VWKAVNAFVPLNLPIEIAGGDTALQLKWAFDGVP
jgi:hypothetical protein